MRYQLYALLILGITIPAIADYYHVLPKHPTVSPVYRYLSSINTPLRHDELQELSNAIEQCANMYKIDPRLIIGIIAVESQFDRFAVSNRGAIGLMQVMYDENKGLRKEGIIKAKRDLFDITKNVEAGTHILSNFLSRYKMVTALWHYNGKHPDTKRYADQVLTFTFNIDLQ